jgi:holo-[acyl-carrier protein] synthase
VTVYHVGVDLIEIERSERVLARWGERFLKRVYTGAERGDYQNRAQSLVVRFAAKEAVMKALGTGIKGVGWRAIEVLPNRDGKPLVHLYGGALKKAQGLGLGELAISLSHAREYAIASVVGGSSEDCNHR